MRSRVFLKTPNQINRVSNWTPIEAISGRSSIQNFIYLDDGLGAVIYLLPLLEKPGQVVFDQLEHGSILNWESRTKEIAKWDRVENLLETRTR